MPFASHPFASEFTTASDQPEEAGSRVPRQAAFVWVGRELMPSDRAASHLLNPAIHFGPGVTAAVRAYGTPAGPAVFQLRPHLDRFLAAARRIDIEDPFYNLAFLRDVVWRVILANDFYQCTVRLALYLEAPLGLDLEAVRPVLAVTALESFPGRERAARDDGLRLTLAPLARSAGGPGADREEVRRWHVATLLAQNLAEQTGYDEAILLDEQGIVTDCGGEQIVLVSGDGLQAAPSSPGVESITAEAVAVMAELAGYTMAREPFSYEQLLAADEAFICGATWEISPVVQVDDQSIGDGRPGPTSRRLQERYVNCVHGLDPAARRWLDYMDRSADPLY